MKTDIRKLVNYYFTNKIKLISSHEMDDRSKYCVKKINEMQTNMRAICDI